MLRNESGDIMEELQKKMQMLIDSHEQEKTGIFKQHKQELTNT
jgi:hypothetical protein